MPIAPGTKLGSYVVEEFLGQGAMGVVYRAYHAQLERRAAVKVLQGLAPEADTVARFRREAQSIARMRHPNVLTVFDFGEFEGTPYMVVEYVEGGNLAGRTRQGPMDRESALRFLHGIGDALDYAHSLGIVHRDVKPANVLLGAHDTPILADFGLAKLLQSSSVKSMTGMTTGTPAYMAPEQVTGSKIGPAADRYSLAVMAFQMLTGSLPFDGEGVMEVLYAHVHRDPPAPSSLNPQLGPKVDEVVARGMAKDPQARWDSCASFVTALESALPASPAQAKVDSTVVMAPPVPAPIPAAAAAVPAGVAAIAVASPPAPMPAAQKTSIAAQPPRNGTRRTLLFAIAAALLVLVLIIGAVVVYGATRPTTIAVTPQIVRAGDHVVVSAHHVPRNQAGDIQLVGTVRSVPFQANGSGDVSVELLVPRDASPGGYIVRICWGGTCHASANLTVTLPVAFVTPGSSPAPGVTATPGVSPSPTHSTSSATPQSSPTATQQQRTIAVSPTSLILPGTTPVTVTGAHFVSGTGTIHLLQNNINQPQSMQIFATGTFKQTLYFKNSYLWLVGNATVQACDSSGACAQTTVMLAA